MLIVLIPGALLMERHVVLLQVTAAETSSVKGQKTRPTVRWTAVPLQLVAMEIVIRLRILAVAPLIVVIPWQRSVVMEWTMIVMVYLIVTILIVQVTLLVQLPRLVATPMVSVSQIWARIAYLVLTTAMVNKTRNQPIGSVVAMGMARNQLVVLIPGATKVHMSVLNTKRLVKQMRGKGESQLNIGYL